MKISRRKNGRFHSWEPGKNTDFEKEKWEISLESYGFLRRNRGDFSEHVAGTCSDKGLKAGQLDSSRPYDSFVVLLLWTVPKFANRRNQPFTAGVQHFETYPGGFCLEKKVRGCLVYPTPDIIERSHKPKLIDEC